MTTAATTVIGGAPAGALSLQSVASNEEVRFKEMHEKEIALLRSIVRTYPNHPKAGINFKDFFPILEDPSTKRILGDLLFEYYKSKGIEVVAGYESRGFPLAEALSDRLNVGFVPLRKPGKLPGPTYFAEYQKEYGPDTLHISQAVAISGKRVLLIDDLIATGGTAIAGVSLIMQTGGNPVGFASILEVPGGAGEKLKNLAFATLSRMVGG